MVLGLGGPNGFELFMERVGGQYLDLICEGLVLDPNEVKYAKWHSDRGQSTSLFIESAHQPRRVFSLYLPMR